MYYETFKCGFGFFKKVIVQVIFLSVQLLAAFSLISLVTHHLLGGLNLNHIWISIEFLPRWIESVWILIFSIIVLSRSKINRKYQIFTQIIVALTALVCIFNAIGYYKFIQAGLIKSSLPIPLSLIICVVFTVFIFTSKRPQLLRQNKQARYLLNVSIIFVIIISMIFVHIMTFGSTDYCRRADAIVVLGAGVASDGEGSTSMNDRVRKACELYNSGYADKIIMSGGLDKRTSLREPDIMLKIAQKYGVPEEDIILDQHGNNTLATVRNTKSICKNRGWSRVLMVSHNYHLARIKMFSEQESLQTYTVPSFDNVSDKYKLFLVGRETIAWGYYYLKSQVAM